MTDLRQTNYSGFYSSIARDLAALQSGNKKAGDIAMYVPDEGYLISPNFGGRRITGEQEREALLRELASEDQIKWVTGSYPNLPGYSGNGVTMIAKVPLQLTKRLDSTQLFGEKNIDPYTHIRRFSTIQELNHWFRNYLIDPITTYVRSKQDQEHVHLIQKVVRYIEDNYHFDLSLDQCAQICGLSPYYLSKLFKKTMELSFIEYLTKYRLDRSIELLRTTDLTIAEISEKVGYQTKNYIRVFKKHIGITPGHFRELPKE